MIVSAGRRQAGFTLLESIIALVIFSMGALALYSWLGVNLQALQRIGEHREAVAAMHSALELTGGINSMATPTGKREIGDLVMEWDAKPIQGPRPGRTQIGRPTLFDVGLYEVQVRILRDGRELDHFSVRQLGYRQARQMEAE